MGFPGAIVVDKGCIELVPGWSVRPGWTENECKCRAVMDILDVMSVPWHFSEISFFIRPVSIRSDRSRGERVLDRWRQQTQLSIWLSADFVDWRLNSTRPSL